MLAAGIIDRMDAGNRAADAFHPEIEEDADGRGMPVHDIVDGRIGGHERATGVAEACPRHYHKSRRPCGASPATQTIYAAIVIAALARIAAELFPQCSGGLLHLSGFAWIAAFVGFAAIYAPVLLKRSGRIAA